MRIRPLDRASIPECDIPVPGIFHFLVVSEKIGTGKKSRNRYRTNLVPEKSHNRYRKNMVPEKSLGTGIGQIWYRKSTSIGIENIWYQKKVSISVSFNILGTVTQLQCQMG